MRRQLTGGYRSPILNGGGGGGGIRLNLPMLMGIFGFIYTLCFSFSILTWKKKEQALESPTLLSEQQRLDKRANTSTSQLLRWRQSDVDDGHGSNGRYTLWSKDDTYFETCRRDYIGNYEWGKALTKFVDKAEAKNVVRAMKVDGLKIPKTLALYNEETMSSDFTLETMRLIPQPYIIKPTHSWGIVCHV